MRFAFEQRQTVRNIVYVDAENETEAWKRLLAPAPTWDEATDSEQLRLPVFKRLPAHDDMEYDL